MPEMRIGQGPIAGESFVMEKEGPANVSRDIAEPSMGISPVMQEIEQIADNPNLSDKEKRKEINDLRKRSGLSKGQMKKITRHLEKIYMEKKKEIEATLHSLKTAVSDAERIFGKGSPQAIAAARRLEEVARVNEPLLQKLDQKIKLYHSMYQAGGCVKKLFKGIGNTFKGVGNVFKGIATSVFKVTKGVLDPRNWIKPAFWSNVVAPVAMSFIPGVGPLLASAEKFVGRAAEKVSGWADKGLEYYERGVQLYRDVTEWPRGKD
jgi:hypothetical protein